MKGQRKVKYRGTVLFGEGFALPICLVSAGLKPQFVP